MKFLKFLLLFGSCMSTSSGADQLLQYSSDNGSDDSGVTKKIDQLIKQNRDNQNLLMYAIKAEKGATYLASLEDRYKIKEAVESGHPVTFSSTHWIGHANPRIRHASKVKAWCAAVNNKEQWIQVNLTKPKTIYAIEVADRAGFSPRQWVRTYKVRYTENGKDWKYYNHGQILQGDNKITILTPFKAKIVRVLPQTWNRHVCLRFEVYFSDERKPAAWSRKQGICQEAFQGKLLGSGYGDAQQCKAKCNRDFRCKLINHDEGYWQTCNLYTGVGAFSADGTRGWSCYKKD